MFLSWSGEVLIPFHHPEFEAGIAIETLEGEPVPVWIQGDGVRVVVCPREGLAPDTTYVFRLGPFGTTSPNHVFIPRHRLEGESIFRTGPVGIEAPITSARRCEAWLDSVPALLEAAGVDTGFETGFDTFFRDERESFFDSGGGFDTGSGVCL